FFMHQRQLLWIKTHRHILKSEETTFIFTCSNKNSFIIAVSVCISSRFLNFFHYAYCDYRKYWRRKNNAHHHALQTLWLAGPVRRCGSESLSGRFLCGYEPVEFCPSGVFFGQPVSSGKGNPGKRKKYYSGSYDL